MFSNYDCWYPLAETAVEPHVELAFSFNHFAEQILIDSGLLLKTAIEGVALLILAYAIFKAIPNIILGGKKLNGKKMSRSNLLLLTRINLGAALALCLEFLLAADIAATVVAPSWDKLGQLAAITVIRTFLNYFLQNETKELEHERQSNIRTMDTKLLND